MLETKTPLLAAVIGAVWTATSLAAVTYTVVRLTDQAGCSRAPSISASGKIVAFESEADLVPPNNSDGNFEIFLRAAKKGFRQITNTTGGTTANTQASLSKSGKRIAFISDRDLVPGGNADANAEVFLFDAKKGITQVTATTGGFNDDVRISGSGNAVVFASDRDITGDNADGTYEIFSFDPKKGITRQITASAAASNQPAVSSNGARIAFASNADFAGTNADGSEEIFLFDKKKGFRQVTNGGTSCASDQPAINAGGTRVAFHSNCDFVGANPSAFEEVFLFDAKKGVQQITEATSASDDMLYPGISANGKRVAFVSNGNLVPPNNADLNYEVFLFVEKKGLTQLSHTTGGQAGVAGGPSLSANGKRIAFELTGEETLDANADDEGEIYVEEEK